VDRACELDKTVPQLKKFLEDGGRSSRSAGRPRSAITLDSDLELPRGAGTERTGASVAAREVLRAGMHCRSRSTTRRRSATGSATRSTFYDNSPVFRLAPDAALKGLRVVAWYPTARTLRSGWAWDRTIEGRHGDRRRHGGQRQAVLVRP
jgi:hypothetical protein